MGTLDDRVYANVKLKSELSAKRPLKRDENISLKALSFLIAVSKLGKTHLVFMQPGAKINSVYYRDNVLEQGLLPGRLSNDDFLFQQ